MLCLRDPLGYAEGAVFVPLQLAPILELCDGSHSLLDIQASISRAYGELLFREQLLALLRPLDDALLLDNPRFAAHAAAVHEEFRLISRRPALLAGRSYPGEAEALRRELDCLRRGGRRAGRPTGQPGGRSADRPGRPPHRLRPRRAVVRLGLPGAGRAAEVDRWIVLGTVHAPIRRAFALTRKSFETPLGEAEADGEFLDGLLGRVGEGYLEDEFAHRGEHSIEFQAVWLRHSLPAHRPVRIVPILCGSFHRFTEEGHSPAGDVEVGAFLAGLRETIASLGGRTVLIASADLAHVGPQFGDAHPVTRGRLREVEAADRALLQSVEAADPEAFFRGVARDRDRRRICGLPPIYALLSALGGGRGRLLRYGQWPDPDGTRHVRLPGPLCRGVRGARGPRPGARPPPSGSEP